MTTGRINQISVAHCVKLLYARERTETLSNCNTIQKPLTHNAPVDNRQVSHVRFADALTTANKLANACAIVPRTDTKINTYCSPIQVERIRTGLSQNTVRAVQLIEQLLPLCSEYRQVSTTTLCWSSNRFQFSDHTPIFV